MPFFFCGYLAGNKYFYSVDRFSVSLKGVGNRELDLLESAYCCLEWDLWVIIFYWNCSYMKWLLSGAADFGSSESPFLLFLSTCSWKSLLALPGLDAEWIKSITVACPPLLTLSSGDCDTDALGWRMLNKSLMVIVSGYGFSFDFYAVNKWSARTENVSLCCRCYSL